MLTEEQIQELISLPKEITGKSPSRNYREEHGHKRCDLTLVADEGQVPEFSVFVRQHLRFQDNFSIGLRYPLNQGKVHTITLVRYNGAHGELTRSRDGHFALPHIHFITQDELMAGHSQPQEIRRVMTDRYSNLEQALRIFFMDTATKNYTDYFPELLQARFI